MPCGEDWLSHPLGIVQGFFGEWRRRGRAGRWPPSLPSPGPYPAARPHAGLPRRLSRPAGPAGAALRHPGAASMPGPGPRLPRPAGRRCLPPARFAIRELPRLRGEEPAVGRDCRLLSPRWRTGGPRPLCGSSRRGSLNLRGPAETGQGKALCLRGACRIFQNFRCVGGVLALSRSWL